MTIKLNGSTAGSVALDAPASTTGNADIAFNLPVADGTSGQALTTNGSGALSFATVSTPTYTEYSTHTIGGANSYSISITGDPKVLEVSLY